MEWLFGLETSGKSKYYGFKMIKKLFFDATQLKQKTARLLLAISIGLDLIFGH
jgi:hypothetical protein